MTRILTLIIAIVACALTSAARERYIVISKADYTLTLYDENDNPIFSTVCSSPLMAPTKFIISARPCTLGWS